MIIFVLGFGKSAKNHLKHLLAFSSVSCVYIFTDSPSFSTLYPDSRVSFHRRTSINSFLDINVDYILIASSTDSHYSDFLLVSSFVCPIIVEKPLTSHYDLSCKLLSISVNKPVYVFLQRRLSPFVLALNNLITSSILGSPISCHFNISKYKPPSSIGLLSHLGIHYIDLIFYLLKVTSFSLSSFFVGESCRTEHNASLAGVLNESIVLSGLLSCSSTYSSGVFIDIIFSNARIFLSDSKVKINASSSIKASYLDFVSIYSKDRSVPVDNLSSYYNFWDYIFHSNSNLLLLPTVDQCLLLESFIEACYSFQVSKH